MDDSFRTFLESSKLPKSKVPIQEGKIVQSVNIDPRTKILQEKVVYFCKKYGEIGADALDDFFKESVEKFSGFKSFKITNTNTDSNVVESKVPTDPLQRANAILMGESNPHPSTNKSSKGDDIMAKAMALMG